MRGKESKGKREREKRNGGEKGKRKDTRAREKKACEREQNRGERESVCEKGRELRREKVIQRARKKEQPRSCQATLNPAVSCQSHRDT